MQQFSKSKIKLKSRYDFSFEAIGTRWNITVDGSDNARSKLERIILERIEQFDKNYSRFRSDSLVNTMAQKTGTYRLPPDSRLMMDLYKIAYDLSSGEVTPLIGNVLSDAGYDKNYSLKPGKLIKPLCWNEAMDYSFPFLEIKVPVLLDFGAFGKGYLVDIISELLQTHGLEKFTIDAGGDILAFGEELQVGLEHPDDPTMLVGTLTIDDMSICGSAGNRRSWDKYHHIMSPSKLESPKHIKAVWAIANSTLLADMMTTCLYFVDPSELQQSFDFEYLIIDSRNNFSASPNFPKGMFE
jgi:thiamine biosynthesis lipoprotein